MNIKINDIIRLKHLPGPDMVVQYTYTRKDTDQIYKINAIYWSEKKGEYITRDILIGVLELATSAVPVLVLEDVEEPIFDGGHQMSTRTERSLKRINEDTKEN